MNVARAVFFFSLGALVGAHKYHVEYWWPSCLNPRVQSPPAWLYTRADLAEAERVEAENAAYYASVCHAMQHF